MTSMNDYILFKDINDKYMTLPELVKRRKEEKEAEAKDGNTDDNADRYRLSRKMTRETIYYVTDKNQQGQYIQHV